MQYIIIISKILIINLFLMHLCNGMETDSIESLLEKSNRYQPKPLYMLVAQSIIANLKTNSSLKESFKDFQKLYPLLTDEVIAQAIQDNPSLFLSILPCKRKVLRGHSGSVTAVAFHKGGRWALTGSTDCTVRLWDLKDERCVLIFKGHSKKITSLAFHHEGKIIAAGSEDGKILLWDLSSKELLINIINEYVEQIGLFATICSLKFEKDILIYQDHEYIRYFHPFKQEFSAVLENFTVSSGKKCCIYSRSSSFANHGIHIVKKPLDEQDMTSIISTLSGDFGEMMTGVINDEETMVLTGSNNQYVVLWDVVTGACIKSFRHNLDTVRAVAFGEDNKKIFSVASEPDYMQIKVWDIESGKEVRSSYYKIQQPPIAIKIINDNECYISFIDRTVCKINIKTLKKFNSLTHIEGIYPLCGLLNGKAELYEDDLLTAPLSTLVLSDQQNVCLNCTDFCWVDNNLYALFGLEDHTIQLWTLLNVPTVEQFIYILELEKMKKAEEKIVLDEELIQSFDEGQQLLIKNYFDNPKLSWYGRLAEMIKKKCV